MVSRSGPNRRLVHLLVLGARRLLDVVKMVAVLFGVRHIALAIKILRDVDLVVREHPLT